MQKLANKIARALLKLAKEVLASYAFDDFKAFIAKKYDMLREADGLVAREIEKGGYAVHHFSGPTRLIDSHWEKEDPNVFKRYKDALTEKSDDLVLKRTLEDEIKGIVLLPVWFHNYLHQSKIAPLRSRKEYYRLLRLVLETEESYKEISALKFHGDNFTNALTSLKNLSRFVKEKNDPEILDALCFAYEKIRTKLLNDLGIH